MPVIEAEMKFCAIAHAYVMRDYSTAVGNVLITLLLIARNDEVATMFVVVVIVIIARYVNQRVKFEQQVVCYIVCGHVPEREKHFVCGHMRVCLTRKSRPIARAAWFSVCGCA
jgi:hypothetical protein